MNWRQLNKRQRLLARWTAATLGVGAIVTGLIAVVSRSERQTVSAAGDTRVKGLTSILSRQADPDTVPIRFRDVTEESGITFRHFPDRRASLLPEDMGSGVACADFDRDGLPDLFFVNFAGSITRPLPDDKPAAQCRLYRNLGGLRFEDVTDHSGLGLIAFALGAAWADYDNDGDSDLYVTAFGENRLYANLGDGTFDDVTADAGVGDSRFAAGGSWADYDRDGDLDLYACNYVNFIYREEDRGRLERQYRTEQPYTLNPSAYEFLPNVLYRNNGDGTFTDVAAEAGVADPQGRSLSASWVDLDNDGWPDLYVANDVSNNAVFLNNGDGTFKDIGADSYAADYRGAMGIAVADLDDDLDQDLLVTHWIAQENALFRNMLLDGLLGDAGPGRLWFLDNADEFGLGQIALDAVGWATGFSDLDNDGNRDLWIVNGSTMEDPSDHAALKPQHAFVFWNRGGGDCVDVAAASCPRLATPFVGRGGAQADFDLDGRVDLVFIRHGGKPILLHNVSRPTGRWLRISLRQAGGNTGALGARVYVTANGTTRMAAVGASSSYLSQDERVLHFGLGDVARVDSLRIVWPDGAEETHPVASLDCTLVFTHAPSYPVAPP